LQIKSYRTTMPFLDDKLSPITDKGRALNIDRDLKRRKDLDKGFSDHTGISSPDTVDISWHINDPFHGEDLWNRSGLLGDKVRRFVVYLEGGKQVVYENRPIHEIVADLGKKNKKWRLISPMASSDDTMMKTANKETEMVPIVADLLSSCFKIETESHTHGVKEVGSCFFVKPNILITCAHVISRNEERFESVSAYVIDGDRQYSATILDVDYELDIAVLYCDSVKHTEVEPKRIDSVGVGESILCVGSPYGYDNNVSRGIISSKDREINSGSNYFFMDLSVYPGSSGGAVVDSSDGRVFGIAAVIVESVGNYGLNAGIPIDVCFKRFSKFLQQEVSDENI